MFYSPGFTDFYSGDPANMEAGDINIQIEDPVEPPPPGVDEPLPGQQPPQQQGPAPVPPHGQSWNQPPPFAAYPPWWAQQPPHVPVAATASPQLSKVHLTQFWTHEPAVWFSHAEALFRNFNVEEDRDKFSLLLPTLSPETLVRVASIVRAPQLLATPYISLKQRLLEVYQRDPWSQVCGLLHFRQLGDVQPSQLMDEMKAQLPVGEPESMLFKALFLERMPPEVRAHVQPTARAMDCQQLAALADSIWLASSTSKLHVAAAVETLEPEEPVAAVRQAQTGRKQPTGDGQRRKPKRGRGGAQQQPTGVPKRDGKKPDFVCWRHCKFGEDAYSCDDPARCIASLSEN